jgi:hypothetical protein
MISKLNYIAETGPRDGTVILSDCGFVKWASAFDRSEPTWLQCNPEGYIFRTRHEDAFECSPTFWQPVPSWIKQ